MTRLTPGISGRGSRLAGSQYPAVSGTRRQLAAGAAVALLAAELALGPVTAGLTAVFAVIGRLGRWGFSWLAVPGSLGVAWVLQTGVRATWTGYLAAPRVVLGYLTAHGGLPAHAAEIPAVTLAWRHTLAGQVPVAIVAAAIQVSLLDLASGLAGSGRRGPRRAGVVVAIRSRYLTWALRRGEVATADGGSLGVRSATGRRAAITWQEAAGGVVLTGADPLAVTATGLDLLAAALAHRKSVVVVDLTGEAVARAGEQCLRARVPPLVFGAGSVGCYQPWNLADPDRVFRLVEAMLDWTSVSHGQRKLCAEHLRLAIRSLAARHQAPPRTGLVDQLIGLLGTSALSTRAHGSPRAGESFPAGGDIRADPVPGGVSMRDRGADADALLAAAAADPGVLAPLREQLSLLGTSTLAGALRRAGRDAQNPALVTGCAPIVLSHVLAERGVALFSLDRSAQGQACDMIARLVAADLTELLGQQEWSGDCLIWIDGCEVVGMARLAELASACGRARVPLLLGSADGPTAAVLADQANVVVVRGSAPAVVPTSVGQREQAQPPGSRSRGSGQSAPRMPNWKRAAESGPAGAGTAEASSAGGMPAAAPPADAGAVGGAVGGVLAGGVLAGGVLGPRPAAAVAVEVHGPEHRLMLDGWAVR